jgi:hypothetical protein
MLFQLPDLSEGVLIHRYAPGIRISTVCTYSGCLPFRSAIGSIVRGGRAARR